MTAENVDTGAGYQADGTGSQGAEAQKAANPEQAKPNGDGTQNQIPKGDALTALVQERQGRRDDVAGLHSQVQAVQQQLAGLQQSGQLAPEPATWKNPHDAKDAPVDYLQAEMSHMQARLDQATQDVGGRLDNQDNQAALNDFERGAIFEIQMAAQEHPALSDAYGFVTQQFGLAAKATGAKGPQLANAVRQNMLTALLNGAQNGRSAPEVLAQLAIDWGFGQPQGKAGGKPPVPPKVAGQEAASQSIGGAAGGGGGTPLGAKQLLRQNRQQLTANKREGLERIKAMARGEVPLS